LQDESPRSWSTKKLLDVKLIAACDGRDLAPFLAVLARCTPLLDAEVIFAHVVDTASEEHWSQMAGHHWLRRHPGPREHARFEQAAERSAQEILQEAMAVSVAWPATTRRPVQLHGNPERMLVRLALTEQVDLVAVGQHHQELGPHALGRCARFVVDHAPCPVLVVRGDELRAAAATLLGDRLTDKRKGVLDHHSHH
jgi:nucleotide-binding universal stress UspA family protein